MKRGASSSKAGAIVTLSGATKVKQVVSFYKSQEYNTRGDIAIVSDSDFPLRLEGVVKYPTMAVRTDFFPFRGWWRQGRCGLEQEEPRMAGPLLVTSCAKHLLHGNR